MLQQQMQQQMQQQQQQHQQQMQQQQQQPYIPPQIIQPSQQIVKPKSSKLKHSKKVVQLSSSEEELSEQDLSSNDLENLKQELAELEKQNSSI
jgi:hypothetical protein